MVNLKAADIFSTGFIFGSFLSDGVHPFGTLNSERNEQMIKKEPMILTVDDLNGDVNAFELIQFMLNPINPPNRPSATEVLQSIDSLKKNCGNFALGSLTGCDTCSDKPCRIGSGGYGNVFKGKFKESSKSSTKIEVGIKSIDRAKVRMPEIDIISISSEMMNSKGHQHENIVRFYDWNKDDKCL